MAGVYENRDLRGMWGRTLKVPAPKAFVYIILFLLKSDMDVTGIGLIGPNNYILGLNDRLFK